MNYFKVVPYAVILFLAGALAVSQWKAERLAGQYYNLMADTSRVVQERDGIYSKLLTVEKQITALRQDSAFKDIRIRDLLAVVKKKDTRITALVAFQATWKPDSSAATAKQTKQSAPGSISFGDTAQFINPLRREIWMPRLRVDFGTFIQGDSVYGYTLTDPAQAFIWIKKRPTSFAVALIEGPGGRYETVLTSDNPYLIISAASGKVIPYAHGGFLARFLDGPILSLGWTHERGVVAQARATVWRIEPFLEFHESGLDYGGRITVWKKKW